MSRSRRRRLATALLVLGLGTAAAVVGVRASSGARHPHAPSAVSRGGVLRLLTEERYASLDPAALGSPRRRDVGRLLYRTLMAYGTDGRSVVPDLAATAGIASDGGRVWTYRLASARYDDGTAVVAGDVVRGIRRSLPRGALPTGVLAGVSAPDPATVVLRFPRPFADADWFVALAGAAPVPVSGPRASGPFRVASLTSSAFRLVRWQGTGPREVDGELGLAGAEIDRRLAASAGADAAAVTDKTVLDVERPSGTPQVEGPDGSVLFTAMNLRRGPFVDLKVRQALQVAFPLTRLRAAGTVLATDLLPPSFPGHHDLDAFGGKRRGFEGDPGRARRMLQEAGYDEPVPVSAALPASTASAADVLRDALGSAGFDVTVSVVPDAQYYQRVGVEAHAPDLVSYAWAADWPTASAVVPPLFTCAALRSVGNANVAGHCDPGFDQQVGLALGELDAERREARWRALDERLVREAVVVPRAFGTSTALVGRRVRGATSAVCYGGAVDLLRLTLSDR